MSDHFDDPLGYVAFLDRPPDDRELQCSYGLSERETEVYRELLTGQTLEAHVHRLYEKTGTENRTELVAAAGSAVTIGRSLCT